MRGGQQAIGQRERLLALGSLTAGLTHELNNPAAAAMRATSSLRERVAGMRHKLGTIASGPYDRVALETLIRLQEEAVGEYLVAVSRVVLDEIEKLESLGRAAQVLPDDLHVGEVGCLEDAIGGLIAESKHAAVLAIDGLKAALKQLRATKPAPRLMENS